MCTRPNAWKACRSRPDRIFERDTVAGQEFHQTYQTSALAESRLAELRTYARQGRAFDTETGLPVPEVRQAQTAAATAAEVSWYQHAVRYVTRRWDGLSGNSRRSIAETLTTITTVLLAPGPGRPGDAALRHALYSWAFRNQPDPPDDIATTLAWVAEHSLPVSALADEDVMLDVLATISRTLDGRRAAANTIARKRAVLSNVLDYAVSRGLDANPLPRAAKMWTKPKTTEGVVDPQVVVNRRQAEEQGGPGRAGPPAAQRSSPPAAPDHLTANPAALARRPGQAAVGRPAPHSGKPRTAQAVGAVVPEMAHDNPGWGYRRIHGELTGLGYKL